jgi:hypothetical protein
MGTFSILYLTVIYPRAPKDDLDRKILARRRDIPLVTAPGDNNYKAPLLPSEEGHVELEHELDPDTNHIPLEDEDEDD